MFIISNPTKNRFSLPFIGKKIERPFIFLPPATKLGQGYVFTRVCDSVHRGVSVPACTTGHMTGGSLSGGLSVQGESLSRAGLCPGGSLSGGGLCPGGSLSVQGASLSRGSLSREGSLLGRKKNVIHQEDNITSRSLN